MQFFFFLDANEARRHCISCYGIFTGFAPILNLAWKHSLFFGEFALLLIKTTLVSSVDLIWTVENSMETIWRAPEVLGLTINNLCYQTGIVYPVSKAGTQGFTSGVLRELFSKIWHPRLPCDNCSFTTFKNFFKIERREKITWWLHCIGFHSNFILFKTIKNFVLQAAACGWYKKNAVWALEWIAEVPRGMCIQCWEPRSNSNLSAWNWAFLQ